jgi:hypothetical protein
MRQRRKRLHFTAAQSAETWDRWQKDEGLKSIGRVFGKTFFSIFAHTTELAAFARRRDDDPCWRWRSPKREKISRLEARSDAWRRRTGIRREDLHPSPPSEYRTRSVVTECRSHRPRTRSHCGQQPRCTWCHGGPRSDDRPTDRRSGEAHAGASRSRPLRDQRAVRRLRLPLLERKRGSLRSARMPWRCREAESLFAVTCWARASTTAALKKRLALIGIRSRRFDFKASDCDSQLAPSTRDVRDKAQPIATDCSAACDEMLRSATDCNGMVGVRGFSLYLRF